MQRKKGFLWSALLLLIGITIGVTVVRIWPILPIPQPALKVLPPPALPVIPAPQPPPKPPLFSLEKVPYSALADWQKDNQQYAFHAFLPTCGTFVHRPKTGKVGTYYLHSLVSDWLPACHAARALRDPDVTQARAFFEKWFTPYVVRTKGKEAGLFTGYLEFSLKGALHKHPPFTIPLYARPADLVTANLGDFREDLSGESIAGKIVNGRLLPYASRTDINKGALSHHTEVIAWTDDKLDRFLLQIQGSGIVTLQNGKQIRVGYAGANGYPYQSIGKILVAEGKLKPEQVSMRSIREWFQAHPEVEQETLNFNPSFVFFRVIHGEGPIGSQGVALTPERSLAVDRKFIPLGMPIWLETKAPGIQHTNQARSFDRLMIAQDTGGAIKGAIRGDVFWGHGKEAARYAGNMRYHGRYYLLLPHAIAARVGERYVVD